MAYLGAIIMVKITPDAEKFINDLLVKNQRVGQGIKIYLSGIACSGPQFGMSFQNGVSDGDIIDKSASSFDIYYDEDTKQALEGCVVEFIDDPNFGTGLTIRDPNSLGCSSCGGGCR
jgi:Fe-S cluster assembly iron-binding protein IscA